MKRASPTHGGRWLAQANYDALMTHHTTENTFDMGGNNDIGCPCQKRELLALMVSWQLPNG